MLSGAAMSLRTYYLTAAKSNESSEYHTLALIAINV
jgi:hypothetical protein